MNSVNTGSMLDGRLNTYLASLPHPGLDLTAAQVQEGQRARQYLVESGPASVPALLDRLSSPDFNVKDVCYDLVLEIGDEAKNALYVELGRRGPIVDIWIVAMLRHLGDEKAMDRLWSDLRDPVAYVRHLSALALAFQLLDSRTTPPEELLAVLVDALGNEQAIEGTPFTVAGSALACLTSLSGKCFIAPPRKIQFYNYEHFLYPPPLHPFPFAADYISKVENGEKRNIRARVQAWMASRSRSTAPENGNLR